MPQAYHNHENDWRAENWDEKSNKRENSDLKADLVKTRSTAIVWRINKEHYPNQRPNDHIQNEKQIMKPNSCRSRRVESVRVETEEVADDEAFEKAIG